MGTPGRKKLPAKKKADQAITAWLTPEQKDLIHRAAEVEGDPDGRWLGKVGLRAAKDALRRAESESL